MITIITRCKNPACCNFVRVSASTRSALAFCCSKECTQAVRTLGVRGTKVPNPIPLFEKVWKKSQAPRAKKAEWSPERRANWDARMADPAKREQRKQRFLATLARDPSAKQRMLEKRKATLKAHPEIRQNASKKWKETYAGSEKWQAQLKGRMRAKWAASDVDVRMSPETVELAKKLGCPLKLMCNRVVYTCSTCGHVGLYHLRGTDYDRLHVIGITICRNCSVTKYHVSVQEQEVASFVEQLGFYVEQSVRTMIHGRQELDIYIPERHVAIEYCGLRWHSEQAGKDWKYHLSKLQSCEAKGIRLLTIFGDEWMFRRPVVKSRIRAVLGRLPDRLYARQCTVGIADASVRPFFEANHLQGDTNSISYSCALWHGGEMVAAMAFRESTAGDAHAYPEGAVELSRLCCKEGLSVVGGASKLLQFAIRSNPQWKSIVSFADKRWSDGGVYRALGFELAGQLRPQYSYLDKSQLKRTYRSAYRLHKMPKEWGVFDELGNRIDMHSERDICAAHGIYRIWDCGLDKYVMQLHR